MVESPSEQGVRDRGRIRPDAVPPSLLDLLMVQRTQNESGVRLAFHQSLLDHVTLERDPFLWCALTGATDTALLLHERGVVPCSPTNVASFHAGGASGSTPWKKGVVISVREAALLAGYATTSRVLRNVEIGVPLHWTPKNHKAWPANFKDKVKKAVGACSSCSWFCDLPGPARVKIVEILVQDLARTTVWKDVSPAVWRGDWAEVMDRDMYQAAVTVAAGRTVAEPVAPTRAVEYQFRMAGPQRSEGRGHKLIGVVKRVACLAMWLSAVRGPVGASLGLATVGGVFASLVVPLPVAVLSCGIHLGRSMQALS